MIDELIECLEKGDGVDRDLDARIWLFTTPGATRETKLFDHPDVPGHQYEVDDMRDASGWFASPPAFTKSTDAVAGWIAKNLPGFGHGYSAKSDGQSFGQIEPPELKNVPFSGVGSSPARALAAAALRAFKEQHNATEHAPAAQIDLD